MSTWGLLDEKEEQELHKRRLLNVEEKPFKRITKRLHQINAFIKTASEPQDTTAPEPSPRAATSGADGTAGDDDAAKPPTAQEDARVQQLRELDQLREDLTLDFAAFDTSIARLQFLSDANRRERAGYEHKRQAILDECQAVRDANADLRVRLDGARATLAQRKEFDALADKITTHKLLKPREDQEAALRKLEDECRELERESEAYVATWRERRDQFSRIMEEGMLLRRQIRDEKEEVDRREGMNEDEDEDGEGALRDEQTPRPLPSGNATPAVESGNLSGNGREGSVAPASRLVNGSSEHLGVHSQGSRAPSRSTTPQPQAAADDVEEGEDVEMGDGPKVGDGETPRITVEGATVTEGDKMEVDGA